MQKVHIALTEAVPPPLHGDVQSKLAFLDNRLSSALLNAAGTAIDAVASQALSSDERDALEAKAQALVTSMCDDAFIPDIRTLSERRGAMRFSDDPMPDLLARREVVQEGEGFFAIGPLLTGVMDYLEVRLTGIAKEQGAAPYRFPALISSSYLEKVQYFKNFPHSLAFVSHLNANVEDIDRFAREAHCCGPIIKVDPAVMAAPKAMLSPTICHHLYHMLEGTRIDETGFVATAFGHCFRYESRNMNALERVWNFTMRELIFVGDEDFVEAGINRAREAFEEVLADLDLSYAIMTANDPFFVGTYRDQAAYQAAFELKYEVRAPLPYSGHSIAIASQNSHRNFFGRTLAIRDHHGDHACTGCFGVGYERLALAFVAQHGIDRDHWPATVRDILSSHVPRGGFSEQEKA
ncbi:hypothetical protein CDQ92_19080 [Sphingopyxis bauzanensis]|uniref:Aminoacyl-transfer RNA synthetases class-II family profile domain-containing protein n=1 Tax=Sphingopyxis bauzanensis TaxID=651663 RepID=A0A246JNP4_9SPHN|nr:hypothetical protein [Sphingopyxis bauzanensis]OWQ94113.1 hypothetical protein CDQ92_19080 [Sphingopyxis bauzanensis]GGJ63825.1 hypothetical protein GCM10011393_37730 [Sphingopyxis bauzanensis]